MRRPTAALGALVAAAVLSAGTAHAAAGDRTRATELLAPLTASKDVALSTAAERRLALVDHPPPPPSIGSPSTGKERLRDDVLGAARALWPTRATFLTPAVAIACILHYLAELPGGPVSTENLYDLGAVVVPSDPTFAGPWRYVVADDDGAVLSRVSLTAYDAFNYRVWADGADKRPMDDPTWDWTPSPTGRPDGNYPPFVPPPLISMEGFNRQGKGNPDPWLPANATETVGNNIDAYTSRTDQGRTKDDFRAKVTSTKTFDRVYDFTKEPLVSNDQGMAAITMAFYDTNYLHDYWYDSGFDEPAGNAQNDNLSRGGRGGDRMNVRTQDGINLASPSRNNSNMSTPPDGMSPTMRLFVWDGASQRILHATPPDSDLVAGYANFGPSKFDATNVLVDVDDGAFPSPTDGCEAIRNDVKGKIALIDRGTCTFKRKVVNAELAGAIGVVIVNNRVGAPPIMGNGDPAATMVNIPVLSTTNVAGQLLRARMVTEPVTMRMAFSRDIDRDGGLANTVIFHEWGHYIHHRLANCGASQQCDAMSEGWGDFVALHTAARPNDDLDGVFPLAIYASAQFDFAAYFGIRRYPYSTDFYKNAITFQHIADSATLPERVIKSFGGSNSEVHNAGEVWTAMMWEAYVALQKAGRARSPSLSFEEVRRRMANYVVTSLQMSPVDATYTEARDALLAAAGAASPEDELVIAQAFARRGAGSCAISPARDSDTLEGVVEDFEVKPRLVVGEVTLDDSVKNCDQDGVLDAGETGKLTIHVTNGATTALKGGKLLLSSTTKEATFSGGGSIDVPDLQPFMSTTLSADVTIDPKMANKGVLSVTITPAEDVRCPSGVRTVTIPINTDIVPASSAADDFEVPLAGDQQIWKPGGAAADVVWSQTALTTTNRVYHTELQYGRTDTWLESPDLIVSKDRFFLIRFEHRYQFSSKYENGVYSYLAGGIVELSEDAGMTWSDVTKYANPLYSGKLTEGISDLALSGKQAYYGTNARFPEFDRITLNLFDKLAGKTVRFRFHMANATYLSAAAVTEWDIDNVSFEGIDNKPFTSILYDAGKCGEGARGPMAVGGCSTAGRTGTAAFALALLAPLALLIRRRRRAS